MHQLLATAPDTTPTKPCTARGHPSCMRGFVRDRCRKCTLGSNACTMCHNLNYDRTSSSSPSPNIKNGISKRLELQQRLQKLSYDAPSLPISHFPQPRLSFDVESSSSDSELETFSSSKDSSPRNSLLVEEEEEEVKGKENRIKDTTKGSVALAIPSPTTSSTPDSHSPTATTPTSPTTLGSTSPLLSSCTGPPWTSPPSFSKASAGPASCIFCFNGRQVCEDCFGLGYVQRICQDCFKDHKNQLQQQQPSFLSPQPRRRHVLSLSLPSTPRTLSSPSSVSPTASASATPSSSVSNALSLPWSGLGTRLKEQRWLSGLSLSVGGSTLPSTNSEASSPTWTEVLTPVAMEGESTYIPLPPSPASFEEDTTLKRLEREGAGIVWAEDVNDFIQTPRSPDWSVSSFSKNQDKSDGEDNDNDDDSTAFGRKKRLPRSIITRATRPSSWSSSSPPSAISPSSFKTVVLKHLKVPATLFKAGQDTEIENSDGVSRDNTAFLSPPPHQRDSQRRSDRDKRKRWSVGFANISPSWIPSSSLGASTAGEQERREGLSLSSSGSSSTQEDSNTNTVNKSSSEDPNNPAKRGHKRYWSLSVISPNLFRISND
ncbi:hypothetical protein EMPS_06879 [Entomortierella parvispora]|uniref:Uncharacterized protein n=1 Tax=Entomortierella parvispora TaxID=205924 RepID=A0A9P3HDC2_9FUNG|nr:hypothetical protein EMPS_06879 [Entomortierella parvispora]